MLARSRRRFLSDVSANLEWAWGVAGGFGEAGPPPYTAYFNSLASRVLILFLGGFFLAFGAARFGVDRNLAAIMLRPFGSRPSRVLLGLMLITGILSMWMSNTATTATIMAVVLPIIRRLDADDKFRTGLALGVDYALTHSCYDPAGDGAACGHCDACRLRLAGFQAAATPDPARYQWTG